MEIPSYKFERVDMFEFLPNMIEVLFLWDSRETEKKSKSEDEEEDERKRKEVFLLKWEDEEEDEKKNAALANAVLIKYMYKYANN